MVIAAAARKPKAILCEKPMATCLGEADEMLIACRRNDVKLASGHMRRFFTAWEEAKRLVQSGAIGEPQRLWCVGIQGLLNYSTHLIDFMRWVLNEPSVEWVIGAVERKTDRYERAMRIEDACVGLIGFEGGVQADDRKRHHPQSRPRRMGLRDRGHGLRRQQHRPLHER